MIELLQGSSLEIAEKMEHTIILVWIKKERKYFLSTHIFYRGGTKEKTKKVLNEKNVRT